MNPVKITNTDTNDEFVVGTLAWKPNETKVLTNISEELRNIINGGTSPLVSDTVLAAFEAMPNLPALTDANGTAVVATGGVIAIPAVTDFPTAANAIQTLVSVINAQALQINALRIEMATAPDSSYTDNSSSYTDLRPY